jgi:hypothetical protein
MNNEDPAVDKAGGVESPKESKVTLLHPHTHDLVEVEATEAALVPFMVKGYKQKGVE